MPVSNNRLDRDRKAYIDNVTDGGTDRRVADLTAHDKLDAITNALGGSTSTTTEIINKAVAIADTEVSQALPANTKHFILRSRSRGTLKIAYNSGETSTNYITIMPGNTFISTQFYVAQTLYFQSTKAGDTIEIVASY